MIKCLGNQNHQLATMPELSRLDASSSNNYFLSIRPLRFSFDWFCTKRGFFLAFMKTNFVSFSRSCYSCGHLARVGPVLLRPCRHRPRQDDHRQRHQGLRRFNQGITTVIATSGGHLTAECCRNLCTYKL